MSGFLSEVDTMFEAAAGFINLPKEHAENICVCNPTYVTRFRARLRDRTHTLIGWPAVHSTHDNPAKSGIRYPPNVEQDEVEPSERPDPNSGRPNPASAIRLEAFAANISALDALVLTEGVGVSGENDWNERRIT